MNQFEILLLLFAAITLAAAIIFRAQHSKLSHARQTATTLQNRIATLRLQLEAVHESVESEAQLRADAEARLANAEDLANHASIEMTDLNAQFKLAQRNAKAYSDENATLVAELKRTRREIRRLTKALADRDAELNQTRSEMTTPIESNSSLKTQLALAQQEGHEEKTLRLANQTNQKRANRNERSQGAQREEIEAQLAGARRDVKRLTRELRQLQAKLEQEQGDREARLAQSKQVLAREGELRRQAESALERRDHENDELRAKLNASATDIEDLTRDNCELNALMEDARRAHALDPEQVVRLRRELDDQKRANGAKTHRINEIEKALDALTRKEKETAHNLKQQKSTSERLSQFAAAKQLELNEAKVELDSASEKITVLERKAKVADRRREADARKCADLESEQKQTIKRLDAAYRRSDELAKELAVAESQAHHTMIDLYIEAAINALTHAARHLDSCKNTVGVGKRGANARHARMIAFSACIEDGIVNAMVGRATDLTKQSRTEGADISGIRAEILAKVDAGSKHKRSKIEQNVRRAKKSLGLHI